MSLLQLTAKEAKILPSKRHDSDDNAISQSVDCTSSSCTTVSDKIEERPELFQDNSENLTIALRMLHFCRELAIFCLVMVTYAALTKDPPKVSRAPAAYPFFQQTSLLTDWYRGQISKAIESARSGDIAFVMFYAPWDAESQAARKEFELAAEYMHEIVSFAAVNCWQPHSECRTQYNKVYRWPVLIAYPPHGRGIQYNGPVSAAHMIQFLQKICNPILRIHNDYPKDFDDAYVIAELNTSPGSLAFAVFYTTALRYLEKDPQHRITFYVKPSAVFQPSLHLHLWNETLVFPIFDLPWLPDEILKWIFENVHQVTSWVLPSGSKSTTLSNSMQNGPTLILFTPRNPLRVRGDYYHMLQEIGQEYHNCEGNVMVNIHSMNIKLKRSDDLSQYRIFKTLCKMGPNISTKKIITYTKPVWSNVSSCPEKKLEKDCKLLIEKSISHFCSSLKMENCMEMVPTVMENRNICESRTANFPEVYTTSLLTGRKNRAFLDDLAIQSPGMWLFLRGVRDPRSAENLQKLFHREKCKQFLAAEKIQVAAFETSNHKGKTVNISGLACKTNKSLSLLAMDSLQHYYFAQRLGIDLKRNSDKSAVVILNDKMESHYILQEPINGVSVREFILNFTKSELNRSFDSDVILNLTSTRHPIYKNQRRDKFNIILNEMDTNTFLSTVLKENEAVAVFYYSKQCSFCNGISFVYLTVAKKLSFVKNLIFTRIDGENNILPWEYTMESYPTILFFPSRRKSESRVFPSGIPITVSNLIGFILTNLDPGLKLQAIWSICRQTKFAEERSSCYSSLLRETLSLINNTLKEWRKSGKRQKQVLLYKLKQLRQLHLLFAHFPHNNGMIQGYFNKMNSYTNSSVDYSGIHKDSRSHEEL